MVVLTANTLRKGDQSKLDNLCKKGLSVFVAKASLIKGVYPSEDKTFTVDLGC